MCRKIFKHVQIFCWGFGMAGALTSPFLRLKKTSKQNSKDSQQGRKQFLMALTIQHLTFRGKFDLPVHSLLGQLKVKAFWNKEFSYKSKLLL